MMKSTRVKTHLFWILLAEAAGAVSGWLSQGGMERFRQNVVQPSLSPPALLFPIVWSILYALMGIGAARVSLTEPSMPRSRGLNLFVLQLAVNFLWSPLFFCAQAFGASLLWLVLLWLLVAAMMLSFRSVDKAAFLLQIPYLLWLSFAAWLNYGIWQLNP